MKLWCLRHPEPDIATGVCYGWLDMPAKATHLRHVAQWVGQQLAQAATAADATLATNRLHQLPVFSSPLQRAQHLAQALHHGAQWQPPVIDARLREMHFGDWEGQLWSEIARDQIDAWSAALIDHRPPGGESVRDMAERVGSWLATRRQIDAATANSGQVNGAASQNDSQTGSRDCILVAHAGVIQVVSHLAEHPSIDGFKPTLRLGYGDLLLLDLSGPQLQRHHLRCPPQPAPASA